MVVGQGVVHMRPFSAVSHQPLRTENPQSLRDGRKLLTERRHDCRYTHLPSQKHVQNAKALRIAQRTEKPGGALKAFRIRDRSRNQRDMRV